MAKETEQLAGAFETENTGGLLSGLFAEENAFDRRALWRIGTWGASAVGAVILAVISNQSSLGWRREHLAAADLARQARQIQSVAQESQSETRRLASAVETLNSDRDRLFSRVTVLEQGLDSMTGALVRQNSAARVAATPPPAPQGLTAPQASAARPAPSPMPAPAPQTQAALPPPPILAPVTTIPASLPAVEKPRGDAGKGGPAAPAASANAATPSQNAPAPVAASNTPASPSPAATASLMASKSIMGPPDPAAPGLIEAARPPAEATAAPAPAPAPPPVPEVASGSAKPPDRSTEKPSDKASEGPDAAASEVAVQRTDFAVDLGSANSVGGLRALWRGLLQSNAELAALRPIIVVKEGNTGLGMQLRLAAGPLKDAAAAAKICAALAESDRACDTTVFDGQRLAMTADETHPPLGAKPLPGLKPSFAKRGAPLKHAKKDDSPPSKSESSSTFSSLFSGLKH